MRKLSLLFLPAVIGMMAVGCARIEPEIPEDPREAAKKEEILISKSFQAGVAETRTSLDGLSVLFAEGESISIWDGSGNREYKADEAGSNVSFSGQVSATATEFYALSPYSASTVFTKSGSIVTAKTTLPSEQTAVAGTFADGLNISAAQSDSDDSFSLDNVLTVVKFNLESATLDGHVVSSVELTSTYPLAGDVTVTYGETSTAAAGANTVNKVTLAKADGSPLEDGSYYFVVLPNDGGQISLKFTATDGYTATRTATLKSAFEAGSLKSLGTVKGLNWEAPKFYFMPVSDVTEGTYLIVANNNGALYAAKAVVPSGGNTYGYPNRHDVSKLVNDKGFIVMDDLNDAFIFAGSNNSITIQQSDGKYWYQSGNYTSISIGDSISSDSYYTITRNDDGTFKILNNTTKRYLQYSTSYETFGSYTNVSGIVPTLYRLVDPDMVQAQVSLTTLDASSINSSSAVLNASYSGLFPLNVQNVGFYYGTSASDMSEEVYVNEVFSAVSGTISAQIESLAENTTYYYQVTMQVYDPVTKTYKEFKGSVMSFTTKSFVPSVLPSNWLELPGITGVEDFVGAFYGSSNETDENRNYSYCYSYDWFASLWVAYPLNYEHTQGEASTSKWSYNPNIDKDYQVNMTGSSYPTMYNQSDYSRGHQIPNADRKSNDLMNKQTYYVTNQTPQLQTGFNGGIWGGLETAIRTKLKNSTETVYVVTGPVYQTVGGNETVTYFDANPEQSSAYPDKVPVPNYYWKAILRVKWNGSVVSDAKAIAFWFQHKAYSSNDSYTKHVVSVDDIESSTGLDLFTNLPGDNNSGIEKDAEIVTDWDLFWAF